MVDRNLLNTLVISDEDLDLAFGDEAKDDASRIALLDKAVGIFAPGQIMKGKIVRVEGGDVVIDVGLKSEGVVSREEFDPTDDPEAGDEIQVMLESLEGENGQPIFSKRKADRVLNWERLVTTKKEGDAVRGKVMRKIKGGLLVDIGVPVFLPASQVDVRRPGDIGEYIGHEVDAIIIKIDTERRNIVISRRKMIEETRRAAKDKLLKDLAPGQIRKGIVKNIADFGVFVDLGGIDGLLHITDISWERVNHPGEVLRIDQEMEVMVLSVDPAAEKIALGMKQIKGNPWDTVDLKYPIGSRIKGEVVNLVNYGAFVKLEAGIEGLVHVSEMSWTRRINHPSEVVNVGDMLDVVVLDINKEKQEISLGIKQTEINPWTMVAKKYPPGVVIEGKVRNLTSYGAFVEIEEGIDGLLHVSDMSWTKKVSHPSEMVKKGDVLKCVVLTVDEDKQRIALGLKQLVEDPWVNAIPSHYQPGMVVRGTVTKITNFGVFVELEQDLEGLLHISELADHKVEDPQSEVKVGEQIDVKILRVDIEDRKIGLSRRRAAAGEVIAEAAAASGKKPRKERRGGLEHDSLASLQLPEEATETEE